MGHHGPSAVGPQAQGEDRERIWRHPHPCITILRLFLELGHMFLELGHIERKHLETNITRSSQKRIHPEGQLQPYINNTRPNCQAGCVRKMAPVKTILLYKQAVFHFHVIFSSEWGHCYTGLTYTLPPISFIRLGSLQS